MGAAQAWHYHLGGKALLMCSVLKGFLGLVINPVMRAEAAWVQRAPGVTS